jgi:mono/diheme cytochrome c family protein
LQFDNDSLTKRINDVWGEVRETSEDSKAAIARYKSRLRPAALKRADLANGRRIYDATCASCHILFGEGGKVGPDITGSNRANLDYVLENLLDPSAFLVM